LITQHKRHLENLFYLNRIKKYAMVFFIVFNKCLPEEHGVGLSEIAQSLAEMQMGKNINFSLIPNIELYQQKLFELMLDGKALFLALQVFVSHSPHGQQIQLLRKLNLTKSNMEDSVFLYLSNSLISIQKEFLKLIESSIDLLQARFN